YIKQETAHALNRFLGRKKRTIWEDGYDSPNVLDFRKTLELFAYTILNPVKDNLVNSMEEYPGVSSYPSLLGDVQTRTCRLIARSRIPRLAKPERPWKEEHAVLSKLEAQNPQEIELTFSPYAWKSAFAETADLTDQEVRELILDKLRETKNEIKERKKTL